MGLPARFTAPFTTFLSIPCLPSAPLPFSFVSLFFHDEPAFTSPLASCLFHFSLFLSFPFPSSNETLAPDERDAKRRACNAYIETRTEEEEEEKRNVLDAMVAMAKSPQGVAALGSPSTIHFHAVKIDSSRFTTVPDALFKTTLGTRDSLKRMLVPRRCQAICLADLHAAS